MVNLKDAEGELAAASVAPALLLAEQDVLVLAVRYRRVDVGALGMSVRAVTSRLWNRSPMICCRRILTRSTGLAEFTRRARRNHMLGTNLTQHAPTVQTPIAPRFYPPTIPVAILAAHAEL